MRKELRQSRAKASAKREGVAGIARIRYRIKATPGIWKHVMDPKDRAARAAQTMWTADLASRGLGMEIIDVAPGQAIVAMKARPDMVNGHGIVHGGFIFTLADSAFAFACNTYNQTTVAQQNQITFLAPGREGDTLTATAKEVSRVGRSGVYDVTVTGQDGTAIAVMRGLSRTIKGHIFEEADT